MFYRCYFSFFKCRPCHSTTGWTDRNADCCRNTVDEKLTTATNVVTPETLWLICMDDEFT